ncbi:Uma2 family endonuclease [Cohnella silvisoli]|uniref:Uma2 family endonuclease n=1 Tax=Cohnella silvisoli TaxID=2873699 RepID=A0ABV1KLH6_9BACL|nr:Uma2 family endonuclease [Cohnella silvisoli]MCD9020699.1 Uma2 family endonuclease [Cohnella silvisoli]
MSESKKSKSDQVIKESQGVYDRPERFEIIGGIRYDFLTSPTVTHQEILGNFHIAFRSACSQEGKSYLAPLDVHFDEENIVQPDVIYINRDNLGIIRDGFVFGVPDLVVEILSKSTGRRDKTIKKALYERFGVKEYWLTDPVYRIVEQFVLTDGAYILAATLTEQDQLASLTVPCLKIDLGNIFPETDEDED